MVSLQVLGEAYVRPVPRPMGSGRGGEAGGTVREKIQRAHRGGAGEKVGVGGCKEKLGRGGVFQRVPAGGCTGR